MKFRLLLSTALSVLIASFSFGQLSATHSVMQNMNLCETQSGTITFVNSSNFTSNDSIFVLLPNSSEASSDVVSVSVGSYSQSGDTVIIDNLPSTTTVILSYDLTVNCEAHDVNTYSLTSDYSFVLNSGSWTTQNYSFDISSPVINFIGGDQLHFNSAFLGQGVTREFYFTNSNGSTPFNGVVHFCDTLPHSLSTTAIILDSIYSNSAFGSVLSYQISDSIVEITIEVSNLQQGDTLTITDIAYLNDCIIPQNNFTRFKMDYGCHETDLCQAAVGNGVTFNTSLNFDPNDKPGMLVLPSDIHHEACFTDTVVRTEMFVNSGAGAATGIFIRLRDRYNDYGITFLDTSQVDLYLNSVSPLNALSFNGVHVVTTTPGLIYYEITANDTISPGDTIVLVYTEINKCIDNSEYDNYYNNTVSMHDIWIQTQFLHPCSPSPFYNAGNNASFHQYGVNQQFNNLIGTVGDFEQNWFEIKNIGTLLAGNGNSTTATRGIAYDLTHSLLEVELLIESGLSLTSTDSLLFCSTYNGVTSYLPLEEIAIHYGPSGVDQMDTIRAKFSFPSTFQELNTLPSPTGAPAHFDYKKTPEFYQFFANSSIKFKLQAFCDSVAADSKALIRENFFYIIDTNCNECKLPLAFVEDKINILCPGCILPGWNLTQMDIFRTNIGYQDTNNNHYPDVFALQTANQDDVNLQSVILGDTLEFAIEGFISDGDPFTGYTFSTLGFVFDEGQFLFKGDVGKLEFIGGDGTFIEGNVSTPFSILPSAATAYSDSAIGIDMSISSLNSYGVTSISNYNDSCSIVFNPQFRIIDNFDDGVGANPYIDLKNITTFYLMGGTTFGAPDILVDANTTPIDTIAAMTPVERDSLSYWCVGFDGRYIGVGVDFYNYPPLMTYSTLSGVPYAGCLYSITETIAGLVGDKFIDGATGSGPGGVLNYNHQAPYTFENELRDLYNIDSITFHYPPTLEAYEVRLRTSSFHKDTNSYTSQWTPYNVQTNTNLFTTTPTSVTIYPELFTHTNSEFLTGDNHLTYDENFYLQSEVHLRNTDCPLDSVVNIPILTVDKYISNFPGAQNGDTVISTVTQYGHHSIGVGIPSQNEFLQHDPQFNISTTTLPANSNGNVGLEIFLDLDVYLPYSNLAAIINANINVAPNSFMVFQSPNGNFTNFNVPNVDNITTHYYYNTSTTTSVTPAPNFLGGDPYLELGRLGGRTDRNQSRLIDLYATHNCSSVPPGGVDSLYLIYGWNCFDYPDTLENACFVDTFVVYITMPNTGLNVDYSIQDTISLCDTIHYTATFDPTGFGEVSDLTIEVLNPNNSGIDYLANSAYLNYNGTNTQVEPTILTNSYEWLLDSANANLYDFNELSPSATFTADFLNSCGITDDTVYVAMSATNYCGQIIFQDTFELTPQQFYDLPEQDSLSISGAAGTFVSCSDTNSVSLTVTNLGTSASNIHNEVQVVIPEGYTYVSGGSPTYNSNDTLIFPVPASIMASGTYNFMFDVVKVDSLCLNGFMNAQVILNSPYTCDTNECFYTTTLSPVDLIEFTFDPSALNITSIDPGPMCNGLDQLNLEYTSQFTGTIEVYDANTSTLLGQVNFGNTSGATNQLIIPLSDSSSNLMIVNASPCCPDTLYYAFDCDTICQADASFDISDFCLGDTIFVSSNTLTPGTHKWTYDYFGLISTDSSASFPAAQAGTFTIEHIFNATCGASDTVTHTFQIHMPTSSSIVLNGTNPICQPDSVLLSVQNSSLFSDFLWTNGDTTQSIWVSTAGTYGVSIVDSNGCSNNCQAITVSTSISPTPIVETIYICSPSDSVLLVANNGPNVTWYDSTSGQFNTVVGAGQYTATVCDSSGTCCVTNVYNVVLSNFSFTIPDTTNCSSDSTLVSANFPADSYLWSNGSTGSSTYLENGLHWLSATDSLGCTHTDTFSVTNAMIPVSDFTIEDTICVSDSITCLYPNVDDPSFNHEWIFAINGYEYHNFTANPCFNFGDLGTFSITHVVSNACGVHSTTNWITVVETDTNYSLTIIGQNPFCSGDSVQLTSSGGYASIGWFDGSGNYLGSQDTVTVTSSGVYSSTLTDSNGCEVTYLISVTMNNTPTVVASGEGTICLGDSIQLNASGATTYIWDNGAGTGSSVYVSPTVTTTYTVEGTTGGCSASDQVTVTVLPIDSLSQSISLCPGDSVVVGSSVYSSAGVFTDTLVSQNGCDSIVTTSITLFTDSSFVQNIELCEGDSLVLFGNVYYLAGTYTDVTTTANGCDQTITTVLTINPTSYYTQYITICEDTSVTVLGNVYNTTGVYVDSTVTAAGCDSIITTDLIVNSVPYVYIEPVDTLCIDVSGDVEIIVDPGGGTLTGTGITGNTFDPNFAGVGSHTITYTIIDADTGCEGTTSIVIVVEKCANIDENGLEGVTLHPNPNKGAFKISGLAIGTDFEITDSRGRVVKSGKIQSEIEEIDLYGVETGVYYLNATKNGVSGSINFVIMK